MPFIYSLSGLYTDEGVGLIDVVLVKLRPLTPSEIVASEISSSRFTLNVTRNFLKFYFNCHLFYPNIT